MNSICKGVLMALWLADTTMFAAAGVRAEIVTDVAPPAPRAESPPPPRAGYAWAPGHWEWNNHFYVWVSGTWISERRGKWIPDQWVQTGTQWHYLKGHWER